LTLIARLSLPEIAATMNSSPAPLALPASLQSPWHRLILQLFMATVIGLALGSFTNPGQASNKPLVTPQELKSLIDRKAVRVLDIREIFQNDGKTPNYAAGHIPGAVAAPYSSIRGPESNPGSMISEAKLSSLLSKWGVTPDTHVVIASSGSDGTDFGAAARFYWTLKISGIKKISILEGGLGAWGAMKLPLETITPSVPASKIQVKFDRQQIVTTQELAKLIQERDAGRRKLLLSDSRSEDYFSGKDRHSSAARGGTLPGAKNLDHEEWFQLNTGKLHPAKQLESIAKSEGLTNANEVISFCNTGHWSATTWFVLSEVLGRPNVRMYPESMIGWAKTRNLMDNESAQQNRLDQLKGTLKK
jgi:thiosulfate/3-mercaptopyruvate sulfurtransferase